MPITKMMMQKGKIVQVRNLAIAPRWGRVLTKNKTTLTTSMPPLSNSKHLTGRFTANVMKHMPVRSKRFTATGGNVTPSSRSLPSRSTTSTASIKGQLHPSKSQIIPGSSTTPTVHSKGQQYSRSLTSKSTTGARRQLGLGTCSGKSLTDGHKTRVSGQLHSVTVRSVTGESTTPTTGTRGQLPIFSKGCGSKISAARKLLPSPSLDSTISSTNVLSTSKSLSDVTPMSEDECDVLNKDESCSMHEENVKIFQELRSTNLLLGKLIGVMRQTERRVEALEEKASTSASSTSSNTSGASERKTKAIPLQIRVITCVLKNGTCMCRSW